MNIQRMRLPEKKELISQDERTLLPPFLPASIMEDSEMGGILRPVMQRTVADDRSVHEPDRRRQILRSAAGDRSVLGSQGKKEDGAEMLHLFTSGQCIELQWCSDVFALAGAEGFEPSTKVLETHVLPLHHAPVFATALL